MRSAGLAGPQSMARILCIEYPGAACQVMDRGDRREAIFRDDADRQRWSGRDLAERPKTDFRRARIARQLRQETTMRLVWVTHPLDRGMPKHVEEHAEID